MLQNVKLHLNAETCEIRLVAKLAQKSSNVELCLPWVTVDDVEATSDDDSSIPTDSLVFKRGKLVATWQNFLKRGYVISIRGVLQDVADCARVRLFAPARSQRVSDMVVDSLTIEGEFVNIEVSSGTRLERSKGMVTFASVSMFAWIFASNRPLRRAHNLSHDDRVFEISDAKYAANLSELAVLPMVIVDTKRRMNLPFEFAVSPGATMVFVSPKAQPYVGPTLTNPKTQAFWEQGLRFSSSSRFANAIPTEFMVDCALRAVELGLAVSDVIHNKDLVQCMLVAAYPFARTLAIQPEYKIVRTMWLNQVATFMHKTEMSCMRTGIERFAPGATDLLIACCDVAVMNFALGLHAMGSRALEFFLEECRSYKEPPSEMAIATVGRLSCISNQFTSPRIPLVVPYSLTSKCYAQGQKSLVLPLHLAGVTPDRQFPIHLVELFQPVQVSTVQADVGQSTFFVSLKDEQVANKCGRTANYRALIVEAWSKSNFNFAHGIRLANEATKRKFWVVQPPLAIRSVLVDPLYSSLMVPVRIELALAIMLETVDTWRFSEEVSGTILHVIGVVRSLCEDRSSKVDATAKNIQKSYISAMLCAMIISPPAKQPPAHVAIVRSEIVQRIELCHLVVALQVWVAEKKESILADIGRFDFMNEIVDRISVEKDSKLVRGFMEFCLSLLQTSMFVKDMRPLEKLSLLIVSSYEFDEERFGSAAELVKIAKDSIVTTKVVKKQKC